MLTLDNLGRWANGNMAGAVEKRKATLAAKKAAQANSDTKPGANTPKSKGTPKPKKEAGFTPKPEQPPQQQSAYSSGNNSGMGGYY